MTLDTAEWHDAARDMPRMTRRELLAACCPESRLCEGGCGQAMCEDHGLQPAPTCGSHVECIDCNADNPCQQCQHVRRELERESA